MVPRGLAVGEGDSDGRTPNEIARIPLVCQSPGAKRDGREGSADSQQPPERPSIIEIEDRVDEGVESAIDVAEPRDEVYHPVRRAAGRAKRHDDVHEEERQPADDEDAHDDAQGPRGASFLGQRDPLSLLDELVDGRRGGGDGIAGAGTSPGGRGGATIVVTYRHFGRLVVDQRRLRLQTGRRALIVIRLRADRLLGIVGLVVPGGLHRAQPALPGAFSQPPARRQEDLQVNQAHQQQRYEERAQRRVYDVALPSSELAGCAWFQFLRPVVPAGQRRRADRTRENPHAGDRPEDSLEGALLSVIDRIGDRPVTV